MIFEKSCGAIVYTIENMEIKYLLVEEMSGFHSFPKGHMEGEETEEETALREIKEETNLEVELSRDFRVSEQYDPIEKPGVTKQVVYFLAEYSDETPIVVRPDEVRSLKSLSFEEALDILEHNNMKEILKQADEHIKQYVLRCGIQRKTMRAHDYEIKTERLLLRPMTVADMDAVWKWVSDERVARYMVYPTYTDKEKLREWLHSIEEFHDEYNFGYVRLSDNELIGSGSIGPSSGKEGFWGFGYNFRYDCWKMGYATEAAKAMIDFAKREFGITHFCSSHVEPNLASGHVMEKCGLHFVGYGECEKLDGSCKARSMEYEGIF